jgi:hypothetical protein
MSCSDRISNREALKFSYSQYLRVWGSICPFIRFPSAAMSLAMQNQALIFIGAVMIAISRITSPAFG